jgi:predicted metal-dependent hydrolase
MFSKQIKLYNREINYIIRINKRARSVRLSVHTDGSVIVTTPCGVGEDRIERFIQEKSKWLLSKIEYFKQFKSHTFLKHDRSDYLKHKQKALELARERVGHYSAIYKFNYNRISVRNQKTRWGSCSLKGNLNFNYKISLLPKHLADYIIVHEVCHLGELNHSKRFWNLVAKTIPNHQSLRSELRTYRMGLR